MKVIDSNVFIAALIRDGKVRELIVNSDEELLMPEIVFEEIKEHKEELIEKSGLSEEEFEKLISKLRQYLTIVQTDKIISLKEEANSIIGKIDKDDVLFIATSLAFEKCPIWSDDEDFKKQTMIKIYSTVEIIKLSRIIS